MISTTLADRVLSKLDGWTLYSTPIPDPDLPDPDLPDQNLFPETNNTVTLEEINTAWNSMLSKAKLHIKNNPIVFSTDLIKDFTEAVTCWTASELWRKYNHRTISPGEEGVSQDTRAKDLYFDGKSILDNLKTGSLHGLS